VPGSDPSFCDTGIVPLASIAGELDGGGARIIGGDLFANTFLCEENVLFNSRGVFAKATVISGLVDIKS
jgi:hypothetical protein